jgi:hypothetical protein
VTRAAAAREMLRVAGRDGLVLSLDLRRGSGPRSAGTPTIGLDEDALRSLFGEPRLLRRVALRFDLAQLTGRHALLAQALALARPLRSHMLGLWNGRTA